MSKLCIVFVLIFFLFFAVLYLSLYKIKQSACRFNIIVAVLLTYLEI